MTRSKRLTIIYAPRPGADEGAEPLTAIYRRLLSKEPEKERRQRRVRPSTDSPKGAEVSS